MEASAKFFKDNGYLLVANFLPKEMCELFYYHVLLSAERLDYITHNKNHYSKNINIIKDLFGDFNDKQAFGDYSKYGEPIFDALLGVSLEKIQKIIGLNLIPTYTYHRLYTLGTELKKHIDRESCEISTTLCLGYNISNLENKNWNWPMWIKNKKNEEIPIFMKPGDMLIYKGCELYHWREPYVGLNHAQVFMHYNEKNGNYNNENDGRPILGMPSSFKFFKV